MLRLSRPAGVTTSSGGLELPDSTRAAVLLLDELLPRFVRLRQERRAARWFGGEGQPPGICEVPLEVFTRATDRLIEEGCERVAYVGTSKGAEAALLIATDDPRVGD